MMRTSILVVVLMSLAGCAGGSGGGAVPLSALETRPYHAKHSAGSAYRLKQDVTINGQLVKKGRVVEGLPKVITGTDFGTLEKVEWLIRPGFEHIRGEKGIIYAKRFGASTWVRFDMSGKTPKEEPSPYTDVVRIFYNFNEGYGYDEQDRWVGVDAPGKRLAVFGPDGKPAVTFEDVADTDPKYVLQLLRRDGAMVVRHRGYDRLYDRDGTPISPELSSLWSADVYQSTYLGGAPKVVNRVYGLQTVPNKPRYWLVLDNGRNIAKPDDLIGLEPLSTPLYYWTVWSGWLVWWQTPEGERCARVELKDTNSLAALIASRERADCVEWAVRWNAKYHVFEDIVRRAGQTTYDVYRRGKKMNDRPLASVAAADTFIADLRKEEEERMKVAAAKSAAAAAQYKAARERELARQETERAAAERAQQAAKTAAAQRAFDAAMAANKPAAARVELLKLTRDPERWTQYVRKYGLDPAGNYGSNSVSFARAQAGGTDTAVLTAAVEKAKPKPATPVAKGGPQSDWDYFWNGPRDGNYVYRGGSGYDPNKSIDAALKHLDTVRQQNHDAYMRGAQNWGRKP